MAAIAARRTTLAVVVQRTRRSPRAMTHLLHLGVGVENLGDQGDPYSIDVGERTQVSDATAGVIGAGRGAEDHRPGPEGGPAGRGIAGVGASADQGGAFRSDRPGDDGQVREGGQESAEQVGGPALPSGLLGVRDRDGHGGSLDQLGDEWETITDLNVSQRPSTAVNGASGRRDTTASRTPLRMRPPAETSLWSEHPRGFASLALSLGL